MSDLKKNSVFLSSVYSEFIDERRDVINAILQNGDLPICMEKFNSSSGRTTDILRRYIMECDYFVLLIGDEYGDIEPQSQVSYTEYEYNVAIELGLKPIVFLKRTNKRTEQAKKFVERIQKSNVGLWRNWDTLSDLVTSVITSLREAEINDPRDGWVRGGVQIESCSSTQYTDFVISEEQKAQELIILPKRLNTAYKPYNMIVEIAEQRYGHGIDVAGYNKYINGHMERSRQFFSFLENGKVYYELFDKHTLIEYAQGMHHNGIKSLNKKYMLEMLEKWKETIRKYPQNYFIGLVDAILPFKYEIFDKKIVSMHETVGRHAKNRISALVIRDKGVVKSLVNDFETMWNTLDPEECTPEFVCDWIDKNLIAPIATRKKGQPEDIDLCRGENLNSRRYEALGMLNCRDLGGLITTNGEVTKYGSIYRGDCPSKCSNIDIEMLRQSNITLCIDLRHPTSTQRRPSILNKVDGIRYVNIGYSDASNSAIAEKLDDEDFEASEWTSIYVDVVEKERMWVKEIFESIAHNPGATLFHCTWGRDRSGLLSILLLLLAKVKSSEITADYIVSNAYCHSLDSDNVLKGSRDVEIDTALFLMDYLKNKYYTIENYLFSCGISLYDIEAVKRKLVNG